MRRAWRGKRETRELAAETRDAPTPTEQILWEHLRSRPMGVKFRRQHPIGGFIADFYAASLGLVVEVDGRSHEGRELYDAERDLLLRARGVCTLRVTANDVEHKLSAVAERMVAEIVRLRSGA